MGLGVRPGVLRAGIMGLALWRHLREKTGPEDGVGRQVALARRQARGEMRPPREVPPYGHARTPQKDRALWIPQPARWALAGIGPLRCPFPSQVALRPRRSAASQGTSRLRRLPPGARSPGPQLAGGGCGGGGLGEYWAGWGDCEGLGWLGGWAGWGGLGGLGWLERDGLAGWGVRAGLAEVLHWAGPPRG